MPKTTNAEANRKIKQIASMAGINTPATENGVTAPKWTFVRAHTARWSAATNLAMQGVPLDFIAKLGGWKKLEVLKKYLLASGLDVAKVRWSMNFLGEVWVWNLKILSCQINYYYTSLRDI